MIKNFYTILDDVLTKKYGGTLHEDLEFNKNMSSYMLIRYLSMRDSLLPYARILNKFQFKLGPKEVYLWCYHNIPKQKNGFIKYISKNRSKKK